MRLGLACWLAITAAAARADAPSFLKPTDLCADTGAELSRQLEAAWNRNEEQHGSHYRFSCWYNWGTGVIECMAALSDEQTEDAVHYLRHRHTSSGLCVDRIEWNSLLYGVPMAEKHAVVHVSPPEDPPPWPFPLDLLALVGGAVAALLFMAGRWSVRRRRA